MLYDITQVEFLEFVSPVLITDETNQNCKMRRINTNMSSSLRLQAARTSLVVESSSIFQPLKLSFSRTARDCSTPLLHLLQTPLALEITNIK